jgi:superfamily I DNA and/or RNA helicase
MGGQSKSNTGQAELVAHLIPMLTGTRDQDGRTAPLKLTVLSPYTKQLKTLQGLLPSSVDCFTIDSFQGRESDIIIFTTVRCNETNDVGFLEDKRRLNVVWTRAKLALIIIGDRGTMTSSSELWKRAIESCTEVEINLPPRS